jgi:hypothetical protein
MPLNSIAALTAAAKYIAEVRKPQPASTTLGASYWKTGVGTIPPPGVTPATTGAGGTSYNRLSESGAAIAIPSGALRLAALRASLDSTQEATLMLVDRLVACSGLALNTLTPQTVTLPTLPRYTDGKGVFAAIELYTTALAASSSYTLAYTNQDGTSGRASATIVDPFVGAVGNTANTTRIFGLQPPDMGVKTVNSLTLSAGSHATAGDLGITLFRPIAMLAIGSAQDSPYRPKPRDWLDTALAEVQSDACLSLMLLSSVLSTATPLKAKLELVSAA